jgi:hypothetical protein
VTATLVFCAPVNALAAAWDPASPPSDWQALREQWHLGQTIRTPLGRGRLRRHVARHSSTARIRDLTASWKLRHRFHARFTPTHQAPGLSMAWKLGCHGCRPGATGPSSDPEDKEAPHRAADRGRPGDRSWRTRSEASQPLMLPITGCYGVSKPFPLRRAEGRKECGEIRFVVVAPGRRRLSPPPRRNSLVVDDDHAETTGRSPEEARSRQTVIGRVTRGRSEKIQLSSTR